MKRSKMSKAHSKKSFSKSAGMTNKRNVPSRIPMRGGIRM